MLMPPFEVKADDLTTALSKDLPFMVVIVRLLAATMLSAIVAYRPWRKLFPKSLPLSAETAQAQIIIAVAGAVMVIIIGDSMARAFGLVGLGAFIRFRSGIKDPRDAAVMFVMIGVGMAVGLGLIPLAVLTTAFVITVLAMLDATGKLPVRRIKVGIELDPAHAGIGSFRPAFPGMRVLEAAAVGGDGKVLIEIDAAEGVDAATILDQLQGRGLAGIRNVSLVDD